MGKETICRGVQVVNTFGIQLKTAHKCKSQLLSSHCIINAENN